MSPRQRVILSTVVAALGGLLFGFDTAVISGVEKTIQELFGLSDWQLGITVASALVGTVVGSLAVSVPGSVLGRRRTLMIVAIFYLVAAIGSALPWNWESLLAFRFLGGLAVGGASVMSPMYIAEIAPARMRGRLVAVAQLNVVLGILLAFFSNYLITYVFAHASGLPGDAWRWMLGVQAVPSVLFFAALFFIPESPRWLVSRRRTDEARQVLTLLGEEDAQAELSAIVESLHEESVSRSEPFLCAKYAFPIMAAFMVATFNQLSGINALMYYAPRIFEMAGSSKDTALLQAVAIGGTNLLLTIAAMFVIDRFGRKPLLLVGSVGTATCLGIVAYALFTQPGIGNAAGGAASAGSIENGSVARLVMVSLIGYIAFFAFSQGAVIWVFISEIFPNRVRAKGQALGSFTHWFWATVVSLTFPRIASISGGYAFACFSVMMLVQFFFVWRVLPETKGVSLEQIQKQLGIE